MSKEWSEQGEVVYSRDAEGRLHSWDGPARASDSSKMYYFLYGRLLTKSDWELLVKKRAQHEEVCGPASEETLQSIVNTWNRGPSYDSSGCPRCGRRHFGELFCEDVKPLNSDFQEY